MENRFSLLKQEMYDGEAFVSYERLKKRMEAYIYSYNHERTKETLRRRLNALLRVFQFTP
ncbi:IS3 family transposase [Virgibacillus halotolerans]|uniref:IS3 family transposase n=1 Tax=Virgibacillus halotolerans TaxID=1071053 RepID=UPI001960373A